MSTSTLEAPKVNPFLDIDVADVIKAIYWRSLGEIDLYTNDQKVKTVKGNLVDYLLRLLQVHKICVLEME